MNTKKAGIIERLKATTSKEEVKRLMAVLRKYEHANQKTIRRAKRIEKQKLSL